MWVAGSTGMDKPGAGEMYALVNPHEHESKICCSWWWKGTRIQDHALLGNDRCSSIQCTMADVTSNLVDSRARTLL